MSTPEVIPTCYEVSILPEDSIHHRVYVVTVERRAAGEWAVKRGPDCLNAGGQWEFPPMPSEQTAEWRASHLFPLDKAIDLAKAAAPHVVVNGRTAVQVIADGGAR